MCCGVGLYQSKVLGVEHQQSVAAELHEGVRTGLLGLSLPVVAFHLTLRGHQALLHAGGVAQVAPNRCKLGAVFARAQWHHTVVHGQVAAHGAGVVDLTRQGGLPTPGVVEHGLHLGHAFTGHGVGPRLANPFGKVPGRQVFSAVGEVQYVAVGVEEQHHVTAGSQQRGGRRCREGAQVLVSRTEVQTGLGLSCGHIIQNN